MSRQIEPAGGVLEEFSALEAVSAIQALKAQPQCPRDAQQPDVAKKSPSIATCPPTCPPNPGL